MKKYITMLVMLGVVLPSVVLGAWWNPFTWFKASEVQKVDSAPAENATDTSKNQQGAFQDNAKPEVIEKPVTQTITVQDPNLQIKINSLLSENISLKTDNFSLKTQVERLLKSNQSLNENLTVCESKAVPAPEPEIKPNVTFNVTLDDAYNIKTYSFKTEGDEFIIKSFVYRVTYGPGPISFYLGGPWRGGPVNAGELLHKWADRKPCSDNQEVYGCHTGLGGYWVAFPNTLIPAGARVFIDPSSGNKAEITGITLEGVKSGKQITY